MLKGARQLAVSGSRAAVCTILVGFVPLPGPAQAQDANQGQQTFQTLCAACHTIGGGRLVGPDLQGLAERRSEQWIIDFVQRSQDLVQAGDADAVTVFEEYNRIPMPDQPLSDDEVRGVLAYIGSVAGTEAVVPAAVVPAATDEQVALGRDLFQGKARLANNGPSCMSCHDVRSEGVVGGGALAIELTDAVTRLTLPGVGAILRNPPFPVMQRAYHNRPLTDPEVAALTGFLERADEEQEVHQARAYGMQFLLAGIAGTVILLGLYTLAWRQRRKGTVHQVVFDRQVIST